MNKSLQKDLSKLPEVTFLITKKGKNLYIATTKKRKKYKWDQK